MLLLFHNNLFIFRIICLLTIFVLQSPHSPISSPSMIPLHWGSTINQFRVPQNHSGYRQRDSESSIKIWESPGDPATAFYSSRKTGTSEAWRNKQNWERMGEKTGGEAKQLGAGKSGGERVGRSWGADLLKFEWKKMRANKGSTLNWLFGGTEGLIKVLHEKRDTFKLGSLKT